MPFTYTRTIRFGDTDAAGVVYFANILAMCHEAYEASLITSGINIKLFFNNSEIAIPIASANVDFFRPLFCGDRINIYLTSKPLTAEKFEVAYQIFVAASDHLVAKALTKHVCIDPVSRTKKEISAQMIQWLQQWRETQD